MHKVLLVDDNPDVVEYVGEILQHSMQVAYDVATNVEDARRLLKANDYDGILLDLEIPATSRGERARAENGIGLFHQIVKMKGPGVVPIILMTSYGDHALAHTRELDNDGLVFGMPKSMWDKGRPPETAIREAMAAVKARRRGAEQAQNGLQPFLGGTLVIYSDGATLCDRVILDDSSLSPMRDVLLLLGGKDGKTYKHIFRRLLAKKLDTTPESLNGVFFRFRQKVAKVLKDECQLLVQDDDVVRTEHGDHLTEKITVELRPGESIEAAVLGHRNGHDNGHSGSKNGHKGHENGHTADAALGHIGHKQKQRLLAIIGAMKNRAQMTRDEVEALAGVGRSQVTRDLDELENAGLVRRLGANKERRYAYAGPADSPAS